MPARSPGETREERWENFLSGWGALQQGPFFRLWAPATVDEVLSALHQWTAVGSLGYAQKEHQ